MERINRKRKVTFLDLYDENIESFENFEINKKIDRINLEFKKISITRKRKFDIIQEEGDKIIQKNKFIKIYSCSLHDNDKEICNIYNCQGMNYCDMEIKKFDYIN
jgi:hypothetical protein